MHLLSISSYKYILIKQNWSFTENAIMQANNYPALKKLLEQNYFFDFPELQNTKRLGMGKKLLELFLLKIEFEDGTKRQARSNGVLDQNSLAQFIISRVDISEKQHLKLCLGDLCKDNKYEQIARISAEVMRMFGKRVQSPSEFSMSTIADNNTSQSFSMSTVANNNTSQSFQLPKVEKSMFQEEPTNYYKKNESNQEKKQKKNIFENEKTFDTTLLSEISRIDINFSLSDLSLEFDQIGYEKNADKYLKEKVKNYNSQLSLLKQQFNNYLKDPINSEKMGQELKNGFILKFHESTILVKDNLKQQGVYITKRGYGNNKKQAKNSCSLQILRALYESYPGLLGSMQKVKAQKNLQT